MKLLQVQQGSAQWLALRASYFCASEAAAMMGADPKLKRNDLLRMKATGSEREFSEWVQTNLLDKGHEVEAAARSIVESILGEELFPTVGADDNDELLASFDGVTMDGETGFEHKLWNEELAALVRANDLPASHYWQLEQQILVGALSGVFFVCSDGTTEKFVYTIYKPVPGRAEQLRAGWKQFAEDLANYVPVEDAPAAVATPTMALPALSIQVNGSLTLIDNLQVFGEKLNEFIAGLDLKPETDQAFADAEAAVKTLEKAQQALEAAEASALAQTSSIDEMRRTVAMYAKQARETRLMLEKLVKSRKEQIRAEIVQNGKNALSVHIRTLNTRLGALYIADVPANFLGVIKGKKTLSSLRDAVDTELARVKIEANAIADRIQININTLQELASDHMFLFADSKQIVLKEADDCRRLIEQRIADHKKAEEKRLEDERERIRAEEQRRLEQQAERAAAEKAAPAAPAPEPAMRRRGMKPSPTLAPSPSPAATSKSAPAEPTRPHDDDMIAVLAAHYEVHEGRVIGWLYSLNLPAASERLKEREAA